MINDKGYMKKSVCILLLVFSFLVYLQSPVLAQARRFTPRGWQLMDLKKDSIYGASVNRAYSELLVGKKSKQVIVAVIDAGVDTAHEDLRGRIWTNPREIPGNEIDDDHDGFVDDIHGWNFLGGKDGRNISSDSYEGTREYFRLRPIYGDQTDSALIDPNKRKEFAYWLKLKEAREKDSIDQALEVTYLSEAVTQSTRADTLLRRASQKDTLYPKDIMSIPDSIAGPEKQKMLAVYKEFRIKPDQSLEDIIKEEKRYLQEAKDRLAALDVDPNAERRDIVGDDPDNINDNRYGNSNIAAGTPSHGTHVAGIIAANRDNGIGIDGITNNVMIMAIRAVPNGDERDKDIALAIRYAVDHGARVINMSFGKYYSPGKKWVDEAVQYAEKNDVLLVHAAGNEGKDMDLEMDYPNPMIESTKKMATNFITVGASTGGPDSLLAAGFSNYGQKTVDLFAPGVSIYSTVPGGGYQAFSGTSMAAPVVTGIAALIMEYYPSLTARQVKYVIENSVLRPTGVKVRVPGTKTKADFSTLSRTGGIANAYNALKMASTLKGERKLKETSTIKSRLE
ncbi:MAG: peptidase S8 [Bacteroidetes bacterium]|nr:MAG: peptidase S8 [Bacteroidota bacterium]